MEIIDKLLNDIKEHAKIRSAVCPIPDEDIMRIMALCDQCITMSYNIRAGENRGGITTLDKIKEGECGRVYVNNEYILKVVKNKDEFIYMDIEYNYVEPETFDIVIEV